MFAALRREESGQEAGETKKSKTKSRQKILRGTTGTVQETYSENKTALQYKRAG